MKILIVEDEELSRAWMAQLARGEGHTVVTAADGGAGWQAFAAEPPDLVLSDIRMPVLDGLQLLEKIRRVNYDVVVVMVSTLDTPEAILRALQLRANDYLVKPARETTIITLLRKYAAVLATQSRRNEPPIQVTANHLGMRIPNRLDLVPRIADRLAGETVDVLPHEARLGVRLGLVEMITNAIEHGNLGIDYDEKSALIERGAEAWLATIGQRAKEPAYASRTVTVAFDLDASRCEWLIRDEGEGFDWQSVPDCVDPDNLLELHGRGILLTRMGFDEVTYLGKGNEVRLVKRLVAPDPTGVAPRQ